MIVKTHLRKGMKLEEVRRLFHPMKLVLGLGGQEHGVILRDGLGRVFYQPLGFDENDRLVSIPVAKRGLLQTTP